VTERRRTVIVEADRDQRVIVGETDSDVYVAIASRATFLNPLDGLRVGFAIVDACSRALERQFARQASAAEEQQIERELERESHVRGDTNVTESAPLHGS
jgi:hypothetical protein